MKEEVTSLGGCQLFGLLFYNRDYPRKYLYTRMKKNDKHFLHSFSDGDLLSVNCSLDRLQAVRAGGGRGHDAGAKVQVKTIRTSSLLPN